MAICKKHSGVYDPTPPCVFCEVDRLEKIVKTMQEDCDFLAALQAAGVDNWEGYEEAQEACYGA